MSDNKEPRVEIFGARLRELRTAAGLSREELAVRAGMKIGGVRDLEQGLRVPGWDSVLSLAKALGVECTAFTVEPASLEPHKPGRPKKAEAVEPEESTDAGEASAKRKRGAK